MLLNEKTITLQIKVSNRTYNTDTIVDIKRLDMLKKEEKNSIIEICPVRNVIARFGNGIL